MAPIRRIIQKNALAAVMLLAIGTRAIGIASRPIWYDEAFSVLFSEKGPAAMLIGTLSPTATGAADIHPLTYYTILWLWTRIFGESLVAVRALSVLTSLAALCVVYVLTYQILGQRTAIVASLIVALAPFQVHYGQEIRMYALLSLWLLLASYCYWRGSRILLEDNRKASRAWPWWLGFAAFSALAQYTHNLAAFYLIALALWPLLRREWRVVQWVSISGVLALLLYVPWLIHLPSQFAKVDQSYWIDRPGVSRLFTLLLVFVTNTPLIGWELGAGLLAALFIVVIAVLQTRAAAVHGRADAYPALWLLFLSFVPPLILFLFSQWKPVYIERALLPSGAIFCIWLAWVLTEPGLLKPVRVFAVLLLIVAFGIGLYEHIEYAGFPYAPYAALDAHLESAVTDGDVIIHSNKLSMLPAVYYDRRLSQTYIADPPGSGEDTLARSTQQVLGLLAQPNVESAAGSANRVWFILSDRSNQEYVDAGYVGHPDLLWLQQHYTQVDVSDWGELRLYLFSQKP